MIARLALLACAVLAACTPSYVDKGRSDAVVGAGDGDVVYAVTDAYRTRPPACVAIAPLSGAPGVETGQAEQVRRALYAHLAPQGKRDVELARVDFVLRGADAADTAALGLKLGCDAILRGTVLEHGSHFLGVYSRVAVGAELRMVRAADGMLLWEGRHVAASHGGSLPLSPVGLAMGVIDAARNVEEEQTFRVIDDLARRLVSTIPDDRIAALDDPVAAPLSAGPAPVRPPPRPPGDARGHVAEAGRLMAAGDYAGALAAADKAVAIEATNAEAHFLRTRALMKLGEVERADEAIIEAVALDGGNADYLNTLGALNTLRGRPDRALAAYEMAIAARPANGFAWYNTGVLVYRDDPRGAAGAFYAAGLSYMKAGNYGQAAKALADLEDLAAAGLELDREISTLSDALKALPHQGGSS